MIECMTLLVMMFPPSDYVCVSYEPYPVPAPPPVSEMVLFVRGYMPWDEEGYRLEGGRGQCDHTCEFTALGYEVPYTLAEYLEGDVRVAACPKPFMNHVVEAAGYGYFMCWDRFGNVHYDAGPVWLSSEQAWGYAIDLLGFPVHDQLPAGSWSFNKY